MPLGTLHWVPWRAGRGRPVKLTRLHLQLAGFAVALTISVLIAAAFLAGREVGRAQILGAPGSSARILEGEIYQLRERMDQLSARLVQIAEREERVMVAGAGLNMDFSSLFPGTAPVAGSEPGDLFQYIDDVDLKLLLSERLAEAELAAYDSLAAYFLTVTEQLRRIPSIWPTEGYYVSDFGARIDPFTGAVRYHEGIDIAERSGTAIYAPADGVVTFCGWTSGYGLNVVIRHSPDLSTRFAHCSSVCVSVGQSLMRGDLIARIGMTGRAVGPHLHYEVFQNGVQVDPDDYIIRSGPHESVF
jgi:murein DD-endopeptidase MepM/ murein hydrolase activator NlpD